MNETSIKFNLDGLEKLKEQLGGTYTARVGILGESANRTDADSSGEHLTNSEIGIIQILGSISRHIPPRDFLLMPIMLHKRQITQAMSGAMVQSAIAAGNVMLVFKLLGAKAEEYVQMAFETAGFGQWAPNAPSTIAAKGSSKPLINTTQLRRAISSDVVRKDKE